MKCFAFSTPAKKILYTCLCTFLFLMNSNSQASGLSEEGKDHIKYLKEIAKGFTSVASLATPAVVSIEVYAKVDNQAMYRRHPFFDGQDDLFDFFNDDFFQHFFGRPFRDQRFQKPQEHRKDQGESQPTGRGSGCIVSQDGYILTNNHVIKEASEIRVKLKEGKEFEATVVGTDVASDIAVIKIDEKNLPFLKMGDSDDLEIGEWVIAIGNPLGLQASVTAGIVSAKGRDNLNITDFGDLIQTDAAINPGNSGGPLLDLNGEVIGINTAIMSTSGGYMGIGFAVPSKIARHIMGQLINTGEVSRGFLGVTLQDLDTDLAKAFSLNDTDGALITETLPNSPAEHSGIQRGDIVLAVNGKKIKSASAMTQEIGLLQPGSTISITIFRKGKQQEITVAIADRSKALASSSEALEKLGIEVRDSESDTKGVLVSHVKPGSPAARGGIREGDLLISVNKQDVNTKEDYYSLVEEAVKQKKALLLLKQGKATRFVHLSF